MFTVFAAAFFQNCGNYSSFMQAKFIPELGAKEFKRIITHCENYKIHKELIDDILKRIEKEVWYYQDPFYSIGFKEDTGTTSLYSSNMTKAEALMIHKWC